MSPTYKLSEENVLHDFAHARNNRAKFSRETTTCSSRQICPGSLCPRNVVAVDETGLNRESSVAIVLMQSLNDIKMDAAEKTPPLRSLARTARWDKQRRYTDSHYFSGQSIKPTRVVRPAPSVSSTNEKKRFSFLGLITLRSKLSKSMVARSRRVRGWGERSEWTD